MENSSLTRLLCLICLRKCIELIILEQSDKAFSVCAKGTLAIKTHETSLIRFNHVINSIFCSQRFYEDVELSIMTKRR